MMKHFTKDGSLYIMKPQYVFNSILMTLILGLSVVGLYIKTPMMTYICLGIAIIVGISLWTKKLSIDTSRREITGKSGLVNPYFTIPFNDIQNFELLTTSHNFIKTNTSLQVYYLKKGKVKCVTIAQGITSRAMQSILNDIDDIIGDEDSSK